MVTAAEFLGKVEQFLRPLATDLVIAAVLLLIGIVLAKIMERATYAILKGFKLNNWLRKMGAAVPIEEISAVGVKYLLYLLAIIVSLNQIGLTSFVLVLVAVLILVLAIVFILLGFKDFVPNIVAGVSVHQRGFAEPGDRIRVRNLEGVVEKINLLETRLRTDGGDVLFVPNHYLTTHDVVISSENKKGKKK